MSSMNFSARYWLFAGEDYYYCGGMGDFQGAFETLGAAINQMQVLIENKKWRKDDAWCEIFDMQEKCYIDGPWSKRQREERATRLADAIARNYPIAIKDDRPYPPSEFTEEEIKEALKNRRETPKPEGLKG